MLDCLIIIDVFFVDIFCFIDFGGNLVLFVIRLCCGRDEVVLLISGIFFVLICVCFLYVLVGFKGVKLILLIKVGGEGGSGDKGGKLLKFRFLIIEVLLFDG